MNIFIDFDDTITQSTENVVRIVNRRYDRNVRPEDVCNWDWQDVYPGIPSKDISAVFGEEVFFNTLKFKPRAMDVLFKYSMRNNIVIVSKIIDRTAMINKTDWINKHLVDSGISVDFRGIKITTSKGVIDMSGGIMVDDNAKYLNETNAKYKILFRNNTKFSIEQEWDGMEVDNWTDLDKIMHKIIQKEKGITNGKI